MAVMLGSIRGRLPDPTWVPSRLCPPTLDLFQSSEFCHHLASTNSVCLTGHTSSTSIDSSMSKHSCSSIGTAEMLSEQCDLSYVDTLAIVPWLSALRRSIKAHDTGSGLVVNVTAKGNVLAVRHDHGTVYNSACSGGCDKARRKQGCRPVLL